MSGPWALNIEAYRHQQIQGDQHPNEIYAGLRHNTTRDLFAFGGLSAGGLIDKTSNFTKLEGTLHSQQTLHIQYNK
jgi:hypothetical protein